LNKVALPVRESGATTFPLENGQFSSQCNKQPEFNGEKIMSKSKNNKKVARTNQQKP
jgi:hypothetical protein